MLHGVVARRVGGDAREQRGLGERQLARLLAEVRARRLQDAVGAVAVVDRVEVGRQDPLLRPALLELPGERGLAHLACDRALVAHVRVLHELLRDRGAALDEPLAADVLPEGAADAPHVDAPMLVEALVLHGDDRLLHDRRNLSARDEHATLLAAQHGEHGVAVRGVQDRVDLRTVPRRVELGDLARDCGHEAEREGHTRQHEQHTEQCQQAQLPDPAPLPGRRLITSSKPQQQASVAPCRRITVEPT